MEQTGLLTAEAVQRLETMELRARAIIEGHFSGQHRSPYHGASVEFADHREYSPGDELRHLDWRVYGRTDRFFIKEYDAETNMSVHLLVDASRSMAYGSHGVTKLRYAACLAAALAYLAVKQRDAAGLVLFDTAVRTRLAPATKGRHLAAVFDLLETLEPGAETNVAAALETVAQSVSRRGLVVVISDLLDEPERVLRALGYFRHRGHDPGRRPVRTFVVVEVDQRVGHRRHQCHLRVALADSRGIVRFQQTDTQSSAERRELSARQ